VASNDGTGNTSSPGDPRFGIECRPPTSPRWRGPSIPTRTPLLRPTDAPRSWSREGLPAGASLLGRQRPGPRAGPQRLRGRAEDPPGPGRRDHHWSFPHLVRLVAETVRHDIPTSTTPRLVARVLQVFAAHGLTCSTSRNSSLTAARWRIYAATDGGRDPPAAPPWPPASAIARLAGGVGDMGVPSRPAVFRPHPAARLLPEEEATRLAVAVAAPSQRRPERWTSPMRRMRGGDRVAGPGRRVDRPRIGWPQKASISGMKGEGCRGSRAGQAWRGFPLRADSHHWPGSRSSCSWFVMTRSKEVYREAAWAGAAASRPAVPATGRLARGGFSTPARGLRRGFHVVEQLLSL